AGLAGPLLRIRRSGSPHQRTCGQRQARTCALSSASCNVGIASEALLQRETLVYLAQSPCAPPRTHVRHSYRPDTGDGPSGLMFAARIPLAHLSVPSAISLPKSAGEPASTVPPRSASRAFILGSARAALISLLSMSMISTGVPLGAPRPNQPLAS